MKILVVSTWFPYPPDNGSRMRALSLLRHLARRHSLTLLTFGRPQSDAYLEPLQAICDHVEVVQPTTTGGRLGLRGLVSLEPRHYVQTWNPEMHAGVRRHAAGHDVALALQGDAARYLATLATLPRVFEEVEVGLFEQAYTQAPDLRRRLRAWLTWWKFRGFIRRIIGRFERATVVSAGEREHLAKVGCDISRVALIPNGIELPVMAPPLRPRAARLIYPGAVTYSANLEAVRYFVGAVFPLIRKARPDVQFWVTGATDGVDIAEFQTVEGVSFTGPLPAVDDLIAESAVCVVPLTIGGGTRLKVLHAMALGTPVVSTSKGVEGLAIESGQEALVADTPEAFSGQVLRLLAEPHLGAQLVTHGRALVEQHYAWGPIGDALERVLQEAVREFQARRP